MLNDIKQKANVMLTSANDIDAICKPLYNLGITYFSYARIGNDGSRLDLNNDPEMTEYYYIKSNAYQDSQIEADPFTHESGFILWSTFQNDKTIQVAREQFNVDHGITLVDKQKEYCELWHFAATRNNYRIINFYLNNLDILKFFTFYFRDKYKDIAKNIKTHKIQIINSLSLSINEPCIQLPLKQLNKNELIQSLQTNRYYLGEEYGNSYLTHRELECLVWCLNGKTAAETAIIIGASERTIETHLNNIKRKLNCFKQTQLMQKALKLGLIQI